MSYDKNTEKQVPFSLRHTRNFSRRLVPLNKICVSVLIGGSFVKLFGKAQVDINISLGQFIKVSLSHAFFVGALSVGILRRFYSVK